MISWSHFHSWCAHQDHHDQHKDEDHSFISVEVQHLQVRAPTRVAKGLLSRFNSSTLMPPGSGS